MTRAIRGTPPFERFWSHVETGSSCWEWRGAKNYGGYGVFDPGGYTCLAHRLSYEMAYSAIPSGLNVCHHCDNPACVRPSHLFLGTPLENTADAVAKGRMAYGRRNVWFTHPEKMRNRKPRRFLTPTEVADIRLRLGAGEPQMKLATDYGVHRSSISLIANGRRHKEAA